MKKSKQKKEGIVTLVATWVPGYTRSNGTRVDGYYRAPINNTVTDKSSYKGNYNPYTGKSNG